MQYEDSRWKDISKCLTSSGIDAYSPGQHVGQCTNEYVVIRNAGTRGYLGLSSDQTIYELLCYVPESRYTSLDALVSTVKEIMKSLYPMLKDLHGDSSDYHDTDVKAHMRFLQYGNYKKVQ